MFNREKEKEELRQKVELLKAYQRLSTNLDFRRVILKGFCEAEVLNLNRMASREMTNEGKQLKAQQAQAAPVLEAFLSRIMLEGKQAEEDLPNLDAALRDDEED